MIQYRILNIKNISLLSGLLPTLYFALITNPGSDNMNTIGNIIGPSAFIIAIRAILKNTFILSYSYKGEIKILQKSPSPHPELKYLLVRQMHLLEVLRE